MIIYFVTGNRGKFEFASQRLSGVVSLKHEVMEFNEDAQDVRSVASDKAKAAYTHFRRPVIVDDSGFVIPSLDGWPGSRIARVLRKTTPHGIPYEDIEQFVSIAQSGPVHAYWEMIVAYMDSELAEPVLFPMRIDGHIIGERRGPWNNPPSGMQSRMWYCFVPLGHTQTVAEMDEKTRNRVLVDEWSSIASFLRTRVNE